MSRNATQAKTLALEALFALLMIFEVNRPLSFEAPDAEQLQQSYGSLITWHPGENWAIFSMALFLAAACMSLINRSGSRKPVYDRAAGILAWLNAGLSVLVLAGFTYLPDACTVVWEISLLSPMIRSLMMLGRGKHGI